jgi:hypothetical protein
MGTSSLDNGSEIPGMIHGWLAEVARDLLRPGADEEIRACLARYAAGAECAEELERLGRRHPRRFRARIEEMLARVRGSASERLSRLAPSDVDTGSPTTPQAAEAVFAWAIRQAPAVRAGLADELRPYALELCQNVLPRALASNEAGPIKAALELVEAWGKALPLPDPRPWLRHPDPEVRARALRILLYAPLPWDPAPEVLAAFEDESAEVRAAACLAAARLRLEGAVPALVCLLRSGAPGQAQAAAGALAEMGPPGLKALGAELSAAWEPGAAAAALGALEQLKGSHYGYARL